MTPEQWNNLPAGDKIGKAMGFNPTAISHKADYQYYLTRVNAAIKPYQTRMTRNLEEAFYDQFRAWNEGDRQDALKAQQRIADISRKVIEHNMKSDFENRITADILTTARNRAIMRLRDDPFVGLERVRKIARPTALQTRGIYEKD